ncbi:MAG: histidine phosphatase family protein [Saprospirales bacterium]|nr:histidine phosphatase family protein [Saprospirales bacterium]MBK8492248.1 histidine phosphatase family protein [Saprospirales bacterium]
MAASKYSPFLLLLFFLFIQGCVSTIYVVRHAEKAGGADPGLTAAGAERAEALATFLADKNISAVYATPYNRTRQTAQPTADALGLTVQLYQNDTLSAFVASQLNPLGKNRLVVGHSNTVLDIVRALGATPTMTEIPENDFDNLFIVRKSRYLNQLTITLTETTYGAPSP